MGSVQAPSASRCFQPPDREPASCSSRPLQAEPRNHLARGAGGIGHAVKPRDELEVLAHRQVLIQAEALRHVADLALDLVGLGADVVAEAGAGAFIRRQQAAQHADGGGLAGAVRPEEAVDGAALDLQRQVMDHRAAVEFFGQAVDVDDDVRMGLFRCGIHLRRLRDMHIDRLADAKVAGCAGARLDQVRRAWSAHRGCRSPAA